MSEKRDAEGEWDGAQHDDKRATTVTELEEGNSSSLPITYERWLWMESAAWAERRRSSTCNKRWAATLSVCWNLGVAASLLFFKLDAYVVYCSGESGSDGGKKKGQGGVELTVGKSISSAAVRPPEFKNERLLKVTLEL